MIYQIELPLLEKMCPVFEKTGAMTHLASFFAGPPVSRKELLSWIEKEYEGDNIHIINLVAELKYLDKEKALRTITLDFEDLQEGKWPISTGTSTYIHALLREKKSMYVKFSGTPGQFTRYQHHFGLKNIVIEHGPVVSPEKTIEWLRPEDTQDSAWKNVEWLKSALQVNSQALRYVDKSVWYEKEFLDYLVRYCDGELYHLPDEFFKSLEVLAFFTTLPDIFHEAWHHIYARWYHENSYPLMTGKINELVFHNKDRMLEMLGPGKCIEFYPYLPDSLKTDIDILALACQFFRNNLSSFNLEQHLPESFFTNDAALKCYLLHLYPQSMPRLDEAYRQKLFAHWIHDRQKVLDYLQVISQHGYGESVKVLSSFYPYFSTEIRNDRAVMCYLIEENPEYYLALDSLLQQELLPELLTRLNHGFKTMDFEHVIRKHSHIIYQSVDKEFQKKTIHLFPALMLDAPLAWQYDPELILAMGSFFLDNFILPAHVWSDLCKNETFCLALINQVGSDIYKILPSAAQLNPVIALAYLEQVKLKNIGYSLIEKTLDSSHDCIAPVLWQNRNFCFDAVLQSEKNAQYIPSEIWHDSPFILKVAQAVQEKKLKYTVFSYAPAEIDQFFQLYRSHKNQLHDFLSAFIWQRELENTLDKKEPEKKKGKI